MRTEEVRRSPADPPLAPAHSGAPFALRFSFFPWAGSCVTLLFAVGSGLGSPRFWKDRWSTIEVGMTWLVAVILSMVAAVLFGVFHLLKVRSRNLMDRVVFEFGNHIRLAGHCGILTGRTRVPGVLILLPEKLVYRSVLGRFDGEILLFRLTGFTVQSARTSANRRVRKYRNASVLQLSCSAPCPTFVLSSSDAPIWQEHLRKLLA